LHQLLSTEKGIRVEPIIPQNFVRLGSTPGQTIDTLGPLADLAGQWVGSKGWNIIAVPAPGSVPEDEGQFLLLVRPYVETLTFFPVGAPVRNRGGAIDQFVGALEYELRINDAVTSEVLHVENGMWMYLGDIRPFSGPDPEPAPEFTIARSAAIPHGDSAMVLGNATVTPGGPVIPDIETRPADIGVQAPLGYLEPYILDQPIDVVNPNSLLREAIAGQTILSTTTLTLDSANQGGINNVPFIVRHANASRMQCTFWIETVQISETQTIQQLQYSQNVGLDFHKKFGGVPGLITWPHVNINTLVKQ
jgi:hypothetical protein